MPFARVTLASRLATVTLLCGTLAIAAKPQEPPAAPTPQNTPEARPLPALNYTQPVSHFPNPVGPYTPRHVAPPNLTNTPRLEDLMHDGKLYISMNDAVTLALEN